MLVLINIIYEPEACENMAVKAVERDIIVNKIYRKLDFGLRGFGKKSRLILHDNETATWKFY